MTSIIFKKVSIPFINEEFIAFSKMNANKKENLVFATFFPFNQTFMSNLYFKIM